MSDLSPGVRVLHPMFGGGTVRAVSGTGPAAKITVDFGSAVGQKKLIASAANLRRADATVDADEDGFGVSPSAPLPPLKNAWVECLDAEGTPRSGRRPLLDKIALAVAEDVRRDGFWMAVRERVRLTGRAPRVLDDINGKVSVSVDGMIRVRIRVEHPEFLRTDDHVVACAVFDLIYERFLIDVEHFAFAQQFGAQFSLVEEDLVRFNEGDAPEPFPDRAPLRRPKPVQPKGVIRSMPKRRDDY